MSSLLDWVHREICSEMGQDTPTAYSEYVLEIESLKEVKEYMEQLYGPGYEEKVNNFVKNYQIKRTQQNENMTIYRKGMDNTQEQKSVRTKKKKEPKKVMTLNDLSPTPAIKTPLDAGQVPSASPQKKKTTYVSLYGKDGESRINAVLLPGRNVCECQAQKHRLVNNCLSCGRVVCEQEGSGPCLFCGEIVCTTEEKKVIARESAKSEKLLKKLQNVGGGGTLAENSEPNKALEKAQAYKDRLLDYDRTYVQRTKVIDDESDYFSSDANVWLSPKEREQLKKREKEVREIKFGSRLHKKVTLDFAGRRVVDEEVQIPSIDMDFTDDKPKTNPVLQENFPELPMPKFIPKPHQTKAPKMDTETKKSKSKNFVGRLQDKELQQMSDHGMCLSMHQPWASLLVKGIKKHEGRTWYSNHRGRLWIAAASHKPTDEEILSVELQHRQFVDSNVEFPKEYPTSCLLGCVNVEDVSPQEEYRNIYPSGESGSPYVFVCSGFEELLLKLPVSGSHKIWKLPPDVHRAAKKGRTILHDEF